MSSRKNPYFELFNAARRQTVPNSVKEIETIALNIGQMHNAFGMVLKDLMNEIVQKKTEASCLLIEQDEIQKHSEEVLEEKEMIVLQQQSEVLEKEIQFVDIREGKSNKKVRPQSQVEESINQQVQLEKVQSQSDPKPQDAPLEIAPKIKCFICKIETDHASHLICDGCQAKEPVVYELE